MEKEFIGENRLTQILTYLKEQFGLKANSSDVYSTSIVDSMMSDKVDKETGKGLSTNDYTTAEKSKLAGIATGAEVNVQSNWNETNTSSDAFILNKPTIDGMLTSLPVWTATPTDDTYLLRRDTAGAASYGQVKFSTVWDYIKGKADSVYLPKTTVIPTKTSQLTNDSGFLTSHQAVSNKGATLAWSTTSTIATIGSTDIKVTMPANPNTNTTYSMTRDGENIKLTPSSGTAQTVSLSSLINGLSTGTSVPVDADYYVSQYVGGGTTTTTYHRRPMSAMWSWIKGKADGVYLQYRSIGSNGDYQRVVIGLCELSASASSGTGSHFTGTIVAVRSNGLSAPMTAICAFQDNYSVAKSCNYTLLSNGENTSTAVRSGDGVRACIFTYNSKIYAGLDYYYAPNRTFYYYGESSFTPFIVAYYNQSTSAVINAEINNSITHTTGIYRTYYTDLRTNKINGVDVGSSPKFTDTTYNFSGVSFVSGRSDTGTHDANSALANGHYYYTSNGPATSIGASSTDGALYVQSYSDSWVGQIAQDYRNGSLFVRGKNNGSWTSWKRIIDSTGGTMTGNLTFSSGAGIYYSGTKANYRMIRFIDNTGDAYGNGISIGGGGQTIIGGGESADVMTAQVGTGGSEIMYVGNDGDVNIFTNLQNGWDSRKTFNLNTSGDLSVPRILTCSHLRTDNSVEYGRNGFQFFYQYVDKTSGAAVNANPVSNAWYYILRMNHSNSAGYFVDLAFALNHNRSPAYRMIQNGTEQGWRTIIDSSNISSQSVNYATSAGSASTATSATKATQDGNGSTISSTYLKLSGGTMTGATTVNSTITFGSSDSYGIRTSTDNYGRVGESTKRFYQLFATQTRTTDLYFEDRNSEGSYYTYFKRIQYGTRPSSENIYFYLPTSGGTLATQEWVTTPTIVSSQDLNLTINSTSQTIYFTKFTNGMKNLRIVSTNMPAAAYNGAIIPAAYRPSVAGLHYFAGANYNMNNTASRYISIQTNGYMYIYASNAVGLYVSAWYI